jgi:hypothetical protein
MLFMADTHDPGLEAVYREEAERAGVTPVGCFIPEAGIPLTVFVAEAPDRAWAEIGDYLLADAVSYAQWTAGRVGTASVSHAATAGSVKPAA